MKTQIQNIEKTILWTGKPDLSNSGKPLLNVVNEYKVGKSDFLLNAGKTTNFIYKVTGDNIENLDIEALNAINEQPRFVNRKNALEAQGFQIKFHKIYNDILNLNLKLIDGCLPRILAEMLLILYSTKGLSKITDVLQKITETNPLTFDQSHGHQFYKHKIKNFLTESAMGMQAATPWTGLYNATGGIIIIKQDGDIVCYHIYNRNEFQDYLLNICKFEQASNSRHDFGYFYKEKEEVFIKLNLQIRFTA